jgi:hypothetical protein
VKGLFERMNGKVPIALGFGGAVLTLCLGALSFRDSFVMGFVAILLVFTVAVVWPCALTASVSVRRRKTKLVQALERANR